MNLTVTPFNVFSCLLGSILEGPDAETLGPIVQEVCVFNVLLAFYRTFAVLYVYIAIILST